jgi:hypothetical protein
MVAVLFFSAFMDEEGFLPSVLGKCSMMQTCTLATTTCGLIIYSLQKNSPSFVVVIRSS